VSKCKRADHRLNCKRINDTHVEAGSREHFPQLLVSNYQLDCKGRKDIQARDEQQAQNDQIIIAKRKVTYGL
jgi:hypothetical protein